MPAAAASPAPRTPAGAAAAAAAVEAVAAPPARSRKKLVVLLAASLLLLLALGGGTALWLLKKRAAEARYGDEAHDGAASATAAARGTAATRPESRSAPRFVPLEPFTVNLADVDAERYAQIGITLEIAEDKVSDQIKVYMPAIRHAILMVLADKTAAQVLDRGGKVRLAWELRHETSRVIGFDDGEGGAADEAAAPGKAPRKPQRGAEQDLPIRAVHFSNFIVQ